MLINYGAEMHVWQKDLLEGDEEGQDTIKRHQFGTHQINWYLSIILLIYWKVTNSLQLWNSYWKMKIIS